MNFEQLKIQPKVGDIVYDIENKFPVGTLNPSFNIKSWTVEKIEKDGVWVRDRLLYYDEIYPTKKDCEIEINKN